jgi:uncharacterized protein (TIGR00661 family)
MRILYGVVGVGMGHASRSEVVIRHLLAQGHEVRVVSYGQALAVLDERLGGHLGFSARRIEGLGVCYDERGVLDVPRSVASLVGQAPRRLVSNLGTWLSQMTDFDADAVISDFDSWSWCWAQLHGVPVVALDNLQLLARCEHPRGLVADLPNFGLSRAAIRAKLPGRAYHYVVPTFYEPLAVRPRTTLVGPILRPVVQQAQRQPGEHVVVYQSVWSPALLSAVRGLGCEVRAYGAPCEGQEGNVSWRAFSEQGFVDDLRTAKAVVAGGGFSLMCEAVWLGVPMLSIPLGGHVEQQLNARWLQHAGYGRAAAYLDVQVLQSFVDELPTLERTLDRRPRPDPAQALRVLEVLLDRISCGHPTQEPLAA